MKTLSLVGDRDGFVKVEGLLAPTMQLSLGIPQAAIPPIGFDPSRI